MHTQIREPGHIPEPPDHNAGPAHPHRVPLHHTVRAAQWRPHQGLLRGFYERVPRLRRKLRAELEDLETLRSHRAARTIQAGCPEAHAGGDMYAGASQGTP